MNIIKTYDYRDEQGNLLYQVCRLEPKDFRQRRPIPGHEGEWAWSLGQGVYRRNGKVWEPVQGNAPIDGVHTIALPEVRPIPYRLPELKASEAKGDSVIVVEGEKDVEALRHLDFIATTNSGGAGKWKMHFGACLAGRRVVVLPDNDEPGLAHAGAVAASAILYHAESIRIVRWGRETPEGGDISSWLRAKWPDYPGKMDQLTRERTRREMRTAVISLIGGLATEYRINKSEAKRAAA